MSMLRVLCIQKTSIHWRLLGTFALLIAGLILVAGGAAVLQLGAAQRAAVSEAEHVASEIAFGSNEFEVQDEAQLQRHVENVGKLFDRDIFLVNRQGVVIASTDPKTVGATYTNPDIRLAMDEGVARAFIGPDISEPKDVRQVVVPLPPGTGLPDPSSRGAVVFEYTQVYDTLLLEVRRAAMWTGGATLVLALLGWLLATRVTRSLVEPLADLEHAVAAIANGDYDVRLTVRNPDEVGRLTAAFNRMGSDLQSSRATLRQRNTELAQNNALLLQGMDRIEYLAYHDSLTGLPNRTQFGMVLNQAVVRANRYQQTFGVFFVDLDRFKQVNDTLGHEAGDTLLKEVAQRLRPALRGSDTVARLGGDEFVVLVEELKSDKHAEAVAEKILAAIGKKPYAIAGKEIRVTASIGISRFACDGADEQTLMKHADIAMYQVKDTGKNGYAFYSAERNANSVERLTLESSLRHALQRGELMLNYQPKQDLRTDRMTGMEVLLRWHHPELGMVSPERFIPVAEETGLIVPIGRWVLRQACLQTVAWRERGMTDLVVAVNLSPRQFSDDNLLGDIVDILHETGMDGRWLELEITESAIMQDAEMGRRVLRSLKSLGIRMAMDDFGTGYSSLSTLKRLPIDTLKIDQSFVRDLATDVDDRGLTEAIIQMAKTLNLHLVAEGVETEAQKSFLRERGCDELQGYLYGKPMTASAFESFMALNHSQPHSVDFGQDAPEPCGVTLSSGMVIA